MASKQSGTKTPKKGTNPKSATKQANPQPEKQNQEEDIDDLRFGKVNYALFVLAIIILCIGYLLLYGGGSKDPSEFSPEIFSTRRITIAPLTLLAGFATVFFAILYKPKKSGKKD